MSKHHILIVDDEEDIRLTLEAALQAEGYKTSLAASGEEALNAIKENRPNLVLLDVMMPDLDGYEVCRRIKADNETTTSQNLLTCRNFLPSFGRCFVFRRASGALKNFWTLPTPLT